MGLTATAGTKTALPLIPADVHQGVCYALYDLGTTYDKLYDKSTHKIIILWELPNERMVYQKDGKDIDAPRVISKKYTLSLNEKSSLFKDLQSWRGKPFSEQELLGFDIKNILGNNCMLQIIHRTKDNNTFANIANVLPLYKGIPSRVAENPIMFFSLEETRIIPEGTPSWIADLIKQCDEMRDVAVGEGTIDEDVPF